MSRKARVGDRIVVGARQEKAIVESIEEDPRTHRVQLNLDWSPFGKSRVFEHDEGSVWVFYDSIN